MATNGVRCSYEEIIDMHTESDRVTAIGIHTPTGGYPQKMFKGFFDMYKKYRYLGCSIKFVPVAKLPADPLQVSYEAGEATIDPRDLANPIMFHGCHGDDLGSILNKLYGDDDGISDSLVGLEAVNDSGQLYRDAIYDSMERLYYKALTDRTWKKAGAQRGFMKSGLRPLVYSLATNHQISPSILLGEDGKDLDDFGGIGTDDYTIDGTAQTLTNSVRNNLQLFTPRLTSLGWMETRNVLTVPTTVGTADVPVTSDVLELNKEIIQKGLVNQINYATLPKLFMGVILLAPAYKTEQYYRCIIKHFFAFKQFRGISFRPEVTEVPTYWDKNDGLFDGLEDGHYNEIDIGTSSSGGGGGDDPTITVTNLYLRLVANGASTSPTTVVAKYPGTANFVELHVFNALNDGSSAIYGITNFPVGTTLALQDTLSGEVFPTLSLIVEQRTGQPYYTWTWNGSNWTMSINATQDSREAVLKMVNKDEL